MAWFQVEFDGGLPQGICQACSQGALSAIHFRQLCKEALNQWSEAVTFMNHLQYPSDEDKTYYVFYNTDHQSVVGDQSERAERKEMALLRLNSNFQNVKEEKPVEQKHTKRSPRTARSWQCPDCAKQFALATHLNFHLKNSSKIACTICGVVVYKKKLGHHLSKGHGRTVFNCDKCYQVFGDQISLSSHMNKAHGRPSYQCKVCGNRYPTDRALGAHMTTHTLFYCSVCTSSFDNRKCFVHHQKQCQMDPTPPSNEYICDHCGNSYTKKPSLRIHIIQKHLHVLPYVCETCGKRTSTIAHLKSHEQVHTLARKTFDCHCGAKLRTELGFQLHQRIHTGERPYECTECGDKFLSASRRLDHIKRRHRSTKDMPHGCTMCSARFVRPFELKKHYLAVHSHTMTPIDEESLCPRGACIACTSAALAAQEFRVFVRTSQNAWQKAITAVNEIPKSHGPSVKSLCAFIKPDNFQIHSVKDYTGGDNRMVLSRLKQRLTKKDSSDERKPRITRAGPPCTCPDCDKSFYSPFYLRLHLKNSGHKEACTHCGSVFFRGKEIKEHLEKVHGEVAIICKHCPTIFSSDIRLKKHVQKAHKAGAWTCSDCGRSFPGKASFELHSPMHAVRTCRACGSQFTNRGCYREHRAKCEPDARPNTDLLPRSKRANIRDPATFTCDYCGKTYFTRPQLKNHIIWIHMDVRPHQCQWCGKRFYTPARLAEHCVVHTRERNFECDICGAKLVSRMAVIYHRRRHTGEKPYVCADCGEAFISSSRRLEHAKRRHGKGPQLQCLQCPATFVRGQELKKHMEKLHRTQGQIAGQIKSAALA